MCVLIYAFVLAEHRNTYINTHATHSMFVHIGKHRNTHRNANINTHAINTHNTHTHTHTQDALVCLYVLWSVYIGTRQEHTPSIIQHWHRERKTKPLGTHWEHVRNTLRTHTCHHTALAQREANKTRCQRRKHLYFCRNTSETH